MKNTLFAILLFFALLGFVCYSNNELIKLCDSIIESCEEIDALIATDEWKDAFSGSENLILHLKEDSAIASIYINHTDLDNMISESVKLTQYIRYENQAESQASVNALKYAANNIKRLHKATIENIF